MHRSALNSADRCLSIWPWRARGDFGTRLILRFSRPSKRPPVLSPLSILEHIGAVDHGLRFPSPRDRLGISCSPSPAWGLRLVSSRSSKSSPRRPRARHFRPQFRKSRMFKLGCLWDVCWLERPLIAEKQNVWASKGQLPVFLVFASV